MAVLPVVQPTEGCDDTATVGSAAGVVTEVDVACPGATDDTVGEGGGAVSAALAVESTDESVPVSVPDELVLLLHAPRNKAPATAITANWKLRCILTTAALVMVHDYPQCPGTKRDFRFWHRPIRAQLDVARSSAPARYRL